VPDATGDPPRSDDASDDVSDEALVAAVARVVGQPLDDVPGERSSFVLHAPLELMARAELLSLVEPTGRDAARRRIAEVARTYRAIGTPVPEPAGSDATAHDLAAAISSGDLDRVDRAAVTLGATLGPWRLRAELADAVVARLGAAGHATVYLSLLGRTRPRGFEGMLLRPVARALAAEHDLHLALPDRTIVDDTDGTAADTLSTALATVASCGPAPSPFIAPTLLHAERSGTYDALLNDGVFRAPATPPCRLLRVAAATMLQGRHDVAPYGWSHCLTLSQAPLQLAEVAGDPAACVYVAAAQIAAHWATDGDGPVDLDRVPDPLMAGDDLETALHDTPEAAAAAAWHHPDPVAVGTRLATMASRGHDAHRVKYTLACLDAAAADPGGRALYLAAAAHLCAWWEAHPDLDV